MERTYPSERLMESRIGQLEDYFPQKVFILFFHADVFSSFDSISPCFNQICRHPAGYRPQPAGRYSAPLERLTAAIPWERFRRGRSSGCHHGVAFLGAAAGAGVAGDGVRPL